MSFRRQCFRYGSNSALVGDRTHRVHSPYSMNEHLAKLTKVVPFHAYKDLTHTIPTK